MHNCDDYEICPKRIEEITPGELAAELLDLFGPDGDHWRKCQLYRLGSWCFQGAVTQIVLGKPTYADSLLDHLVRPFADAVLAQFPTRRISDVPHPWMIMEDFNDHPLTGWEDMQLILEKVAANDTQL